MNISLTPELEALIKEKLESGMYHSASEVIREGLRLIKEQDALKEIRLQALRNDIREGLEDADQGRVSPLNASQIKKKGQQRLAKSKKKAA